jgi:hypothetical protein
MDAQIEVATVADAEGILSLQRKAYESEAFRTQIVSPKVTLIFMEKDNVGS